MRPIAQQLSIGPLTADATGSHFNGIASVHAANFTGGYAHVEVVQGYLAGKSVPDPKSDFWTEAEQLLRVGGSWTGGDCADGCGVRYPSWAAAFPDDLDPVDYAVVTGNDVPVYELPRAGSRVLTRLTYDVVKLLVEGGRWTRIVLPDGREGYVDGAVAGRVAGATKYMLWSPLGGSEMGFAKQNNGPWLLTVFYAVRIMNQELRIVMPHRVTRACSVATVLLAAQMLASAQSPLPPPTQRLRLGGFRMTFRRLQNGSWELAGVIAGD